MCNSAACQSAPIATETPLSADLKAARDILTSETGHRLRHWSAVERGYLSAKRELIDALDPLTGRIVIPFQRNPTAQDKHQWIRKALSSACYDERTISVQKSAPPTAEARERWEKKLTQARSEALRSDEDESNWRFVLPPIAGSINHNLLREFGCALTLTEADTGVAAKDGGLTTLRRNGEPIKDIRPGQKWTRALAAYLRAHGVADDKASEIAGYVADKAQVKPRDGFLTVSANALDILLCSENCYYSSCHNLEGCYRAGPQHYLQDDCTIVAFYHETEKTYHGRSLPYKLWRQMVYVDQERGAAALMREYGQGLPDDFGELVRRQVALLLARLKGIDGEPTWFRADAKGLRIDRGANLAYIDGATEYVQLVKGEDGRPVIALAYDVPCACCGSSLDESEQLLCSGCEGRRVQCCSCGERVARSNDYGDTYCDSCWGERFTSCTRCGTDVDVDDARSAEDEHWCERCYDRTFSECDSCSEPVRSRDANQIEGSGCFCDACYSDESADCEGCAERFHNTNLDSDGHCSACAERAALLLERLQRSPRFARLSPVGRFWFCASWERVTSLCSASEDCAAPIYQRN